RQAWTWDRVVRGTHLRANCFSACAWDLYVKDGIVWREEQTDAYRRPDSPLPDYGPRGCQKGACYSSLMTAPDRLLYPMARVGERGSGRWKRISWDEALGRLADAIIDANEEGGPDTVVYDNGTSNVDIGPGSAGEMRLFTMLGATMLDGFGGTGDLAMGAVQTWGTSFVDGSSDDWTRADALVFWHCNPIQTRIPDAHFATEARYGGTTLVTVSPDYSPSAIHASLWVNPRPGTDAALALSVAREIVERGAIDERYVREQTDLAFLVKDDGRFLRESELERGGSDDVFYFFDEKEGRVVKAPGTRGRWSDSIDLGGARPALSGSYEVKTRAGLVRVRPAMELLRERLAQYTAESVTKVTGVGVATQRRLAQVFIEAERAIIYASWGSNKSYHADLLQRSLILISALRGHHGRTGAGVRFAAWYPFEGANALIPGASGTWLQRMLLRVVTPPPRMIEDGMAAATEQLGWTPSHLFLYVHGGLAGAQDRDALDAALARPAREYFAEAIERGWVRPRPAADRPPRVLVTSGVNPLRRWPLPQVVERVLWPKLHMIATVDFRMSASGAKSDLLLPAAGYYEKPGIKYALSLLPYVVVGEQAVAPLGESRSEWWIMTKLAEHIERRARARGVSGDLSSLHRRFTDGGRYGAGDDTKVIDDILRGSDITKGIGWDEARKAGAVRIRSSGRWGTTSGIGSSLEEGGTLSPSRVHVEAKRAWPTLTGRQQFYIDHPWFLEADEALPRYKPLPAAGGSGPILLTGGHNRWSIHAIWRAHPDLLRLQRGEPVMWMAPEDARRRRLADGDHVRVHNERGAFRVQVKVAPAMAPGVAIVYHAWEPYQFAGWRGNMEVVSSPYKPLHLVRDYGHLRNRVFMNGPIHVPRGVPVEIEGAEDASG
ncbi:MAG: hypothetical protein D6760_11765, partial [Deltaproteobacteria bacterium]